MHRILVRRFATLHHQLGEQRMLDYVHCSHFSYEEYPFWLRQSVRLYFFPIDSDQSNIAIKFKASPLVLDVVIGVHRYSFLLELFRKRFKTRKITAMILKNHIGISNTRTVDHILKKLFT